MGYFESFSFKFFSSNSPRKSEYKSRFYAYRVELLEKLSKSASTQTKQEAEVLIADLRTPTYVKNVIQVWNLREDVHTRMNALLDKLLTPMKPSLRAGYKAKFTTASEKDGKVFTKYFEAMKEQLHQRNYTTVFKEFIKATEPPHSYPQALDVFKTSNNGTQADLPSSKALLVAKELADAMDQAIHIAPAESKQLVRIPYVISRDASGPNDDSMDFGRTPDVVTVLDLPPNSTLHAVISVLKKQGFLEFQIAHDLQIYIKETGKYPSHPLFTCDGISWERVHLDKHLHEVGIDASADGLINTMTKVLYIVNKITQYSIIVLTGIGSEIGKILDMPRGGLIKIPTNFLQREYPNKQLRYYLFRDNEIHDNPQPGFFTKNSCNVRVYPV